MYRYGQALTGVNSFFLKKLSILWPGSNILHMPRSIDTSGLIPKFQLRHRVKLAREVAELQQLELAEITGLSRATIAKIEIGRVNPRKVSLMLIAYATGVDLHWLETGEPPMEDTEAEDAA